jgi:hypothetical protein
MLRQRPDFGAVRVVDLRTGEEWLELGRRIATPVSSWPRADVEHQLDPFGAALATLAVLGVGVGLSGT